MTTTAPRRLPPLSKQRGPAKWGMGKFSSIKSPGPFAYAPAKKTKVHCKSAPLAEAAEEIINSGNHDELVATVRQASPIHHPRAITTALRGAGGTDRCSPIW